MIVWSNVQVGRTKHLITPVTTPHLLQVTCSAKAPKDVKHSTDALTEAADRGGHAFACALALPGPNISGIVAGSRWFSSNM